MRLRSSLNDPSIDPLLEQTGVGQHSSLYILGVVKLQHRENSFRLSEL